MHRYLRIWSTVGVRGLLLANLLSALGIGGMPVAILLGLQARFGGLGVAGSAAGLFGAGNAVGLIIQGRLLDRRGQRLILAGFGAACISTLLIILVMINSGHHHPSAFGTALAFLGAGVLLPGLTAAARSRLADHPGLVDTRLAAYALLSITFQAGMAAGPLVVSAIVLLLGPTMGLIACIAALGSAVGCFLSATPAVGRRPAEAPVNRAARPRPQLAGLVVLAAAAWATGAAGGLTSVGIPAMATVSGRPELSGVEFAVIAIGDLIGGLLYGSRGDGRRLGRQLLIAQLAATSCAVAVIGVSRMPIMLAVLLFVGALCGAPAGIATSALLDQVSRPERVAAGYTMIVSSGLVGSAVASAVAGQLADQVGPRTPFVGAPLLLVVAVIICACWLRLRTAVR